MLQDIRKGSQGTAAKVIVGLIVVSFALFGIESILLGGGSAGVAEVNGEDINPQEVQLAVNNQKRRLIAMMGENFDPSMIDDDQLAAQALDGLINRKLLMQAAESMGLAVSDSELATIVAGMEQFQIDGVFSPDMYKSTLASAGYTPASFKQSLREDLLIGQLRAGLAGSDFATSAEMRLNARIVGELRDLRYVTLPLDRFIDTGEVDEASIVSYYEEHQAEFMRPESVVLDYIELSLEEFRQPVEESVLREQYKLQLKDYAYQTRHRVSHILLQESDDTPVIERLAAARAALESGREFADVAREYSDDIGSASGGGDLGYTTGDTFPPEMETAIAALELDTVSKPVKTDAGTHLILVTEREEAAPPSFDDMREELEESVQVAAARTELLRTVETLKDQVFNAEDLNGPADELELEVQRSEPVLRDQASGRFSTPTLLSAAFSEDVLEMGHNSEVLELADDKWIVLRVHQHDPAAARPLAEVRDEVAEAIRRDRAAEAVADTAATLAEGLRKGELRIEDFANENDYEWRVELAVRRDNPSVPATVLQRIFRLPEPADGENTVATVTTPAGDLQVIELMRVQPGELSGLEPAGEQRLRQQITGEFAGFVDGDFQRRLRDGADINVL